MLLKMMQVHIMVESLIFFNPEPQFKDAESIIKNKVIKLLTQLKGFKFVATLVSVFNVGLSPSKMMCHLMLFKNDGKCFLFHLKSYFGFQGV